MLSWFRNYHKSDSRQIVYHKRKKNYASQTLNIHINNDNAKESLNSDILHYLCDRNLQYHMVATFLEKMKASFLKNVLYDTGITFCCKTRNFR